MAKKFSIATKWESVTAEVRAILDRHGAQPDLNVLASIALNNHPKISGKDRDWHLCCAFRALRKELSDQLNKIRVRPLHAGGQQEFEYLKQGYNVERDGAQQHLKLEALTFEELMSKADEYDGLSASLKQEAAELRRYAFLRFPSQAAEYSASKEHSADSI